MARCRYVLAVAPCSGAAVHDAQAAAGRGRKHPGGPVGAIGPDRHPDPTPLPAARCLPRTQHHRRRRDDSMLRASTSYLSLCGSVARQVPCPLQRYSAWRTLSICRGPDGFLSGAPAARLWSMSSIHMQQPVPSQIGGDLPAQKHRDSAHRAGGEPRPHPRRTTAPTSRRPGLLSGSVLGGRFCRNCSFRRRLAEMDVLERLADDLGDVQDLELLFP